MLPNALRLRSQFIAGGASALASFAVLASSSKAAQFEFKCGSSLATDHPTSVALTQMWAAVEAESGGRLRTQFFPGSQLGGDASLFSQVRLGVLQFCLSSPGIIGSLAPSAEITNLGLAYQDTVEGLRLMEGPLGDYVRQEIAAKGLRGFHTWWSTGMQHIGSNAHPIRTPDDLHGFKIRVNESKLQIGLFKTLGASPVPVNYSEIYTALQTKLIDGEAAPLTAIESSKFYEVNKYITLLNHTWSNLGLVANGDAWKSLPADIQAIVDRNTTKYAGGVARETASEVALLDKLRLQGVTINRVEQAPFRASLRPYYQGWADEFGPKVWGLLQTGLGRKLA